VRRCATCGRLDVVRLIAVDVDYMTCLGCLSQDVELDERSDSRSCVCNVCGARSPIDVEEMERRAKMPTEQPDKDKGDNWSG
jgi:transcription elongation factor Elf1